MNPALRTSATGMMAQQLRTEVIANNLANVNTTGFKRSRASFEDLLYQTVQGAAVVGNPDTNTIPAVQVGRGTRLAAVQRLHSQGPVEQTSRPLDLAIEGEGFFQVQLPSGALAYTRDGSFGISDTGTLITSNGYAVVPGIKIPTDATEITISSTGKVSVSQSVTQVDKTELGQLELARFMNPSGLQALGENLFAETPASGQPTVGFPSEEGMGRILQGHLEGSNVEIVQEMVDMITSMRAYEINSKAIKNAEDMMSTANNMIR
ncbi:MAG: flagellar basal-body rod protein FlgG [Gemmatimonadetes bacterium]|nr:flagellar basal-body rod protein FlgG [Gemmatimonadota bacterium]